MTVVMPRHSRLPQLFLHPSANKSPSAVGSCRNCTCGAVARRQLHVSDHATALNSSAPKTEIHHLELRARIVGHLQQNPDYNVKDWEDDGKNGPDGKPCDDWEAFLALIAKPGSYSGDNELRALCCHVQFMAVLVV